MSLTHSDIADILRAIEESALDEVLIQVGDVRVEVRRRGSASPIQASAPAAPSSVAPESPPTVEAAPAGEPALAPGQVAVRSPMVGTFFRRSAPDKPPFVEVGSAVGPDTPLCLVEVMKLYTTVYAQTAGRIAAIAAEDATLVEYDQVLFIIDVD